MISRKILVPDRVFPNLIRIQNYGNRCNCFEIECYIYYRAGKLNRLSVISCFIVSLPSTTIGFMVKTLESTIQTPFKLFNVSIDIFN